MRLVPASTGAPLVGGVVEFSIANELVDREGRDHGSGDVALSPDLRGRNPAENTGLRTPCLYLGVCIVTLRSLRVAAAFTEPAFAI